MHPIYLDNNATTFLAPEVKKAIDEFISSSLGNPSSQHAWGQRAKSLLSEARKKVANYFQCPSSQIIFTSGGTESANLCIRGLLPHKKARILTSKVEHSCVFDCLEELSNEGTEVVYLPVGEKGAVEIADVEHALESSKFDLIVLMAVNNETGVKNDIAAIAQLAEKHGTHFIVDAVAWMGKDHVNIPKGVSALFFSGHKIHALQGIGCVYLKPRLKLHPQLFGGSQEFSLRPGTENLLGIHTLATAVTILQNSSIEQMERLRNRFEEALLKLPQVKLNGTGPRVCNVSNLAFLGQDGESLLIALDQQGIGCSLGSACSSGAIEPSRVLREMGLPASRTACSLRFSLSRYTTEEEIDRAITIIQKLCSAKA